MANIIRYPGAPISPFYLARSEICINDKGECIGNGVFASQNYEAGSHIFAVRRPLVAALDVERIQDTCANCYTWTEGSAIGSRLYVPEGTTVKACTGCKRFKYCSTACQKQAWNRMHKHECKHIRDMITKELPKAVQTTLEIFIRRKNGGFSESEWGMLCGLDTHLDDFKRNGAYGDIQLMAMGANKFSGANFPQDFAEGMYARVLSNSLTLVTPTYDPLGIFIDEQFSMLNHSCDPNAYVVMDGSQVALRALKPIHRDEEIYIAYIDPTNPYVRRQNELKKRWFFTCKCSKCQQGPTLDEDKWLVQPQNLERKWRETADQLRSQVAAKLAENYVGNSVDEKRVAAIQAMAFKTYEEEQTMTDPAEAIRSIENGMRICFQSGLWPVYRQPYAAFRDDLIVNMLSVGNFEIAWAQCAKRYRYILPKLYPQEHHPIRVVQIWQTAMLALYMSQEGPEGKLIYPGVDMGLIALMLFNEANSLCKLSHGENHSFSVSVRKKATEVFNDFREKLGGEWGPEGDAIVAQHREILLKMGDWMQY